MIKVVQCMGRAESFFLFERLKLGPGYDTTVEVDGKQRLCREVTEEKLYRLVPFLKSHVHSGGQYFFEERTVHPLFRDLPLEKRERWRPEFNDLSQPSPRETTLMEWKKNGQVGTQPCLCGPIE